MALALTSNPTCRKSGLVLTCFVDGHKRFRSLDFDSAPLAHRAEAQSKNLHNLQLPESQDSQNSHRANN
jgi:hypothetical protein